MSGVREIAFDTETTGFDARGDDRLTEIGCIELIDFLPTGKTYHTYVDPQRELSAKVTEITGLTTEFLKGKPLFADVAQDFIDFVGDSAMIAHNANFDRSFINAGLERAGFDPYPGKRFIDTLMIARKHLPSKYLAQGFFPILMAAQETQAVTVLPCHYWDSALTQIW